MAKVLKEWKAKPQLEEKYLQITYWTTDLYLEYIKTFENATIRTQKSPHKMGRRFEQTLHQKEIHLQQGPAVYHRELNTV